MSEPTLQSGLLEERVTRLRELFEAAPANLVKEYRQKLEMSWIYHDNALEGVVYSFDELQIAMHEQVVSDSSLIPVYDEIRQHMNAIEYIRQQAEKKRGSLTLDMIKKIYGFLAPDEVEGKGPPKYRKDMPVHRSYFHEIAPPDKISYRMRQFLQWATAPETKRSMHPVRYAGRAHYELAQIYPFPKHNGKVARLVMNFILLHHNYPPAVIHSTERQRYYDVLRLSDNAASALLHESLISSVESGIRFFESALGLSAAS